MNIFEKIKKELSEELEELQKLREAEGLSDNDNREFMYNYALKILDDKSQYRPLEVKAAETIVKLFTHQNAVEALQGEIEELARRMINEQ